MRLGTVRSVGVKKLSASEIPGLATAARKKIGRTAKSTIKRVQGLAYNDMAREDRQRLVMEQSVLGALAALSKDKSVDLVRDDMSTPAEVMKASIEALGGKVPQ